MEIENFSMQEHKNDITSLFDEVTIIFIVCFCPLDRCQVRGNDNYYGRRIDFLKRMLKFAYRGKSIKNMNLGNNFSNINLLIKLSHHYNLAFLPIFSRRDPFTP